MFKTVANKLGHGLYVKQDEKFIWANESFLNMFGYTQDQIKEKSCKDLIYVNDHHKLMAKSQTKELEQYSIEVKGVKKDGCTFDISVSNKKILFEDKPASIGSVIDIGDRKKIECELRESQERYQNLVDKAPIGILVHQKGIIEYANPMAVTILGAESSKDILGKPILSIVHNDFKSMVSKRIDNIKSLRKPVQPKYQKFIRFDGEEIDVEASGMPIQSGGNPAIEVMFWDVTEKKKEEELIKYRAYYDTLTDLPNLNKFILDFLEEINKDQTFTILYLDMEGLKEINELYGRQAGDIVLIKVGARLSGTIGDRGLIYRMTGDEFSIVLPGQLEDDELGRIAQGIERFVSQPIYICNKTVNVSANIGVVFYPNDGVEMAMLLRHAELAVHHAKKSGSFCKKYDS